MSRFHKNGAASPDKIEQSQVAFQAKILSEIDIKALFDELEAIEEQLKPYAHELEELGL